MRSRSAECHISSSADSCAQTSVHQTEVLSHRGLSARADLLFLQRYRQTVYLPSGCLCRQPAVQTAVRIYVRLLHRLHQMPVRYEQYRYHLSVLRKYHKQHKMLFCSVFLHERLHSCTVVHILYIPGLFLCNSPVHCKHLRRACAM